jgi:hypothetical protein
VDKLINAGFKSANNMLLSFISLVFTVKELVTEMDDLSENKKLSVPAWLTLQYGVPSILLNAETPRQQLHQKYLSGHRHKSLPFLSKGE